MPEFVDVVVPYGDASDQVERRENLHVVIERCLSRQDHGAYGVTIVEMGPDATQRTWAAARGVGYVHVQRSSFSVGAAQNAGFLDERIRRGSRVYFHQADFVIPPEVLSRVSAAAEAVAAPFLYPYWGEVHLSRPLSTAVRRAEVDIDTLYAAVRAVIRSARERLRSDGAARSSLDGHVVIRFTDEETAAVLDAVPAHLYERWRRLSDVDAWGTDERSYAPFRWPATEATALSTLVRASAGPRASAAYLCTDEAYRAVGGVPELVGWGYEDLSAWLAVQAVYGYRADLHAVRWGEREITLDLPLVHLWHPVSGQAVYYAKTVTNEAYYRRLARLGVDQRRRLIRPLGSGTSGTAPR